jgi:hypothetical protein
VRVPTEPVQFPSCITVLLQERSYNFHTKKERTKLYRDVCKYGWLNVVAFVAGGLAFGEQGRPLALAMLNVFEDPLKLHLVNLTKWRMLFRYSLHSIIGTLFEFWVWFYLGTHVAGGIERVSNFPVLCSLDGLLDELVVDAFLNIDARAGHADLSLERVQTTRHTSHSVVLLLCLKHHFVSCNYNESMMPHTQHTLLKKMASRDRFTAMSTSAS